MDVFEITVRYLCEQFTLNLDCCSNSYPFLIVIVNVSSDTLLLMSLDMTLTLTLWCTIFLKDVYRLWNVLLCFLRHA